MNRFSLPFWLSLFLGLPSQAQEEDFWVLTNPEAPFVVQDDKRQLSGYVVDLVEGILKQANIQQQILAAPWERVEREARTKSNVLVFALARTPEREPHYHWVTPITANVFALYAKKNKVGKITNLKSLGGSSRVSVLDGDVRESILQEQKYPGIRAYPDWQAALDAVLNDQADTLFFSDAGVTYFCQLERNDCSGLERILIYQTTQSYLVLSKPGTRPDLVSTFLQAAKQYKQSEAFKQMSLAWLHKYQKEVPIPMHLEDGVLNLWQK